MKTNYYSIKTIEGHCHSCGKFTQVVSRVNKVRFPPISKKTDLCESCAVKVLNEVSKNND